MSTLTPDQIQSEVTRVLGELFDLPAEDIRPEARLNEDLGLDSIDAVDMVVQLQNFTGRKFSPEQFKSIRTVEDIVTTVHGILQAENE